MGFSCLQKEPHYSNMSTNKQRIILKAEIVGARIVDIHETYELLEGGCACRVIYFTVDRGFTFTTPTAGYPWTTVHLPPIAKRLEDEIEIESYAVKRGLLGRMKFNKAPSTTSDAVKQIKRRVIAGVYCGLFDSKLGFHYPDGGTIVFEDGSQASNNTVSPHGTGAAGLYFHKASEISKPASQLVDYFCIPLEEDNHS